MAISKRNSRPIAIENDEFRWAVSARSQCETNMVTLVVQPPRNGCRLAVAVPCHDPYLDVAANSPAYNVRSITPGFVRRLIGEALVLGWQPYSPAPDFKVSSVVGHFTDVAGETCHVSWNCPHCDHSYSNEIEIGQRPPLVASCDRSKYHSDGQAANVILFW